MCTVNMEGRDVVSAWYTSGGVADAWLMCSSLLLVFFWGGIINTQTTTTKAEQAFGSYVKMIDTDSLTGTSNSAESSDPMGVSSVCTKNLRLDSDCSLWLRMWSTSLVTIS